MSGSNWYWQWLIETSTWKLLFSVFIRSFVCPCQVSVEPQQSMDLIVTCRPSSTGQFSGTASFSTNSGLPAFEAGTEGQWSPGTLGTSMTQSSNWMLVERNWGPALFWKKETGRNVPSHNPRPRSWMPPRKGSSFPWRWAAKVVRHHIWSWTLSVPQDKSVANFPQSFFCIKKWLPSIGFLGIGGVKKSEATEVVQCFCKMGCPSTSLHPYQPSGRPTSWTRSRLRQMWLQPWPWPKAPTWKDRHDLAHGVEDLGEFAKWVQGCLCKKRVSTHRWIATFDGLLMFYDVLFSLNVLKSWISTCLDGGIFPFSSCRMPTSPSRCGWAHCAGEPRWMHFPGQGDLDSGLAGIKCTEGRV